MFLAEETACAKKDLEERQCPRSWEVVTSGGCAGVGKVGLEVVGVEGAS